MRKTAIVVLIGGAVIAAGAGGIWALNTATDRARTEASDERSFGGKVQAAVELGKTDVSGSIERLESILETAQSDSMKHEVGQQLARQYIVRAQAFESSGDFGSAERDYMRAASVDIANPYPISLGGRALRELAAKESDVKRRVELLDESRLRYRDAVERAAGTTQEMEYRRHYARACISLAQELSAAERSQDARILLTDAMNSAPNSPESEEAKRLRDQL